jgi:hypothetical protein
MLPTKPILFLYFKVRRCQEINITKTWIASLHSQEREGRHCEPGRVKQSRPGTLDCFVPRNDDRNPLNLQQFELKIDIVKCTTKEECCCRSSRFFLYLRLRTNI